jgi:hypothetical protein
MKHPISIFKLKCFIFGHGFIRISFYEQSGAIIFGFKCKHCGLIIDELEHEQSAVIGIKEIA